MAALLSSRSGAIGTRAYYGYLSFLTILFWSHKLESRLNLAGLGPGVVACTNRLSRQSVIKCNQTVCLTMKSAIAAVISICMSAAALAASKRPNLIMVLVDDWGVGYPKFMYNSPDPMNTPAMDSLAEDGIILDSAYAYRFCSPSRASLLTGRAGWRHTAAIDNLIPWTRQEGVDLRYKMWPQRLVEEAKYPRVPQIGKHHQGLYSPEYTPVQRGFTSSYGFLSGGEDHVNQDCFNPTNKCKCRDLYNNTRPSEEPEGEYNTYRFTRYAVDQIREHAATQPDEPMAMYFALHVTHAPIEAPASAVDPFKESIPFLPQRTFTGMVSMADQALANVTSALKETGMWDNTLLLLAGVREPRPALARITAASYWHQDCASSVGTKTARYLQIPAPSCFRRCAPHARDWPTLTTPFCSMHAVSRRTTAPPFRWEAATRTSGEPEPARPGHDSVPPQPPLPLHVHVHVHVSQCKRFSASFSALNPIKPVNFDTFHYHPHVPITATSSQGWQGQRLGGRHSRACRRGRRARARLRAGHPQERHVPVL